MTQKNSFTREGCKIKAMYSRISEPIPTPLGVSPAWSKFIMVFIFLMPVPG